MHLWLTTARTQQIKRQIWFLLALYSFPRWMYRIDASGQFRCAFYLEYSKRGPSSKLFAWNFDQRLTIPAQCTSSRTQLNRDLIAISLGNWINSISIEILRTFLHFVLCTVAEMAYHRDEWWLELPSHRPSPMRASVPFRARPCDGINSISSDKKLCRCNVWYDFVECIIV